MSSMEADMEIQVETLATLASIKAEKERMVSERIINLPVNIAKRRKEIKDSSKMKSDLKKSTAFVKKIKAINAEGLQQCIRDVETLNLNLYMSEIVTALLEINFKPADITGVVKLCAALHCRYDEFTIPLVQGIKESFIKPLSPAAEEQARQRRIQIRLMLELYQLGMVNDSEFFCQLLGLIIGKGRK